MGMSRRGDVSIKISGKTKENQSLKELTVKINHENRKPASQNKKT